MEDVLGGATVASLRAEGSEDRYVSALAQQDPADPRVWGVASGSLASRVRLWDTRLPGPAAAFPIAAKRIRDLQFSPDGQMLAAASDDCSVTVVPVADGAAAFRLLGHSAPVTSIRFSPQEYLLGPAAAPPPASFFPGQRGPLSATASADKTVRFWDLETRECVTQSSPLPGPVGPILFDPAEDLLWIGAQGGLR